MGKNPVMATEKAKDLVRMAVARASLLKPLKEEEIGLNRRALVIGGGIAGITAALGLADQGFEVVIVEKEPQLGGFSRSLTTTIEGADVSSFLKELIERVNHHDRIQVLTEALIVGFSGFKGNFTTEILVGPGMYERKIDHGAVILATGAEEYKPKEYLYGDRPKGHDASRVGPEARGSGRRGSLQCCDDPVRWIEKRGKSQLLKDLLPERN